MREGGVVGGVMKGWVCGVEGEGCCDGMWSDGGVEWWERDGVMGVWSGGRGME